VFGTVASVAALVETADWSIEAALLVFAGTGLTFTLWWIYFLLPSGAVLTRHRERGQLWSYLHVLIFPAITGMGAGLHLAAYVVAHESHLGVTAAVASVAIPVFAYLLVVFGMYAYLMRVADWTHGAMVLAAAGLLALGVALAASGVPAGVCLVVVLAAPVVTVVSYLLFGWRHEEEALRRALAP
jgi:low temperature requirement protein LtrA